MTVGSPLELYTTVFGWGQYGNLWVLLTTTGLAYLPFLGMVLRNVIEPYQAMEVEGATAASVRRMEVDIALALSVIVLAGQPFIALSPDVLAYKAPCASGTARVGSSGTTYDAVPFASLVHGDPIKIPLWWYAVMAVASGSVQATAEPLPVCASSGAGSTPVDAARTLQEVDDSRIDDPALVQELSEFLHECYTPAHSKYQAERPDVSAFPASDTEWPGSQAYLTLPGYYDTLRAKAPISGWPYDPARDTEYPTPLPSGYDPANIGMPYCKEWWTDPTRGLRQKIVGHLRSGPLAHIEQFASWVGSLWSGESPTDRENALIKRTVTTTRARTPQNPPDPTGFSFNQDPSIAGYSLPGTLTSLGLLLKKAEFFAMVNALKEALPMLQALILMGIYTLLPLVVVFSGYRIEAMVLGAIAIFTVKLWTFLWVFALFLQNNLVAALYPAGTFFVSQADSNKIDILTMVMALTYIGLPLLWTAMLGWVGIHVASGLSGIVDTFRKPAEAAGEHGGQVGGRVVATGWRSGGKSS